MQMIRGLGVNEVKTYLSDTYGIDFNTEGAYQTAPGRQRK